ncbi:hypothetical protein IE53DRAFT_230189 [Violaceomyces palustris]|uniref:Uncharacterized protein n=1 Tax=Violaceomyces palustris TaxID=1673888 RepID=A0ACD0NPN2_9BASI|nr:hypothetical protein IE53DRAFT_230189 [Violaceomyces palustris]
MVDHPNVGRERLLEKDGFLFLLPPFSPLHAHVFIHPVENLIRMSWREEAQVGRPPTDSGAAGDLSTTLGGSVARPRTGQVQLFVRLAFATRQPRLIPDSYSSLASSRLHRSPWQLTNPSPHSSQSLEQDLPHPRRINPTIYQKEHLSSVILQYQPRSHLTWFSSKPRDPDLESARPAHKLETTSVKIR